MPLLILSLRLTNPDTNLRLATRGEKLYMPVELLQDVKLKRKIKIKAKSGLDMWLNVTITREGLDFKIKNAKLGVFQTWPEIVAGCHTPKNALKHLSKDPILFLQRSESDICRRGMVRRGEKVVW
jgi:hypothetical protein